jgi:hypothetical protein
LKSPKPQTFSQKLSENLQELPPHQTPDSSEPKDNLNKKFTEILPEHIRKKSQNSAKNLFSINNVIKDNVNNSNQPKINGKPVQLPPRISEKYLERRGSVGSGAPDPKIAQKNSKNTEQPGRVDSKVSLREKFRNSLKAKKFEKEDCTNEPKSNGHGHFGGGPLTDIRKINFHKNHSTKNSNFVGSKPGFTSKNSDGKKSQNDSLTWNQENDPSRQNSKGKVMPFHNTFQKLGNPPKRNSKSKSNIKERSIHKSNNLNTTGHHGSVNNDQDRGSQRLSNKIEMIVTNGNDQIIINSDTSRNDTKINVKILAEKILSKKPTKKDNPNNSLMKLDRILNNSRIGPNDESIVGVGTNGRFGSQNGLTKICLDKKRKNPINIIKNQNQSQRLLKHLENFTNQNLETRTHRIGQSIINCNNKDESTKGGSLIENITIKITKPNSTPKNFDDSAPNLTSLLNQNQFMNYETQLNTKSFSKNLQKGFERKDNRKTINTDFLNGRLKNSPSHTNDKSRNNKSKINLESSQKILNGDEITGNGLNTYGIIDNGNIVEGVKPGCREISTNLENKFRETISNVPKKVQQMNKKTSGS